ncbi:hypothetical protein CGCF413_v012187 [Colletotrichum fructicola]|nr:hypothetical protein CGCF413_v012187 [Colletotrichum fructicola]
MAPQHGQLDHRHHRSELTDIDIQQKERQRAHFVRQWMPCYEICITAPAEHRTIMVLRDVSYRIVHNILQRITSAFRTMML